MPAVAPLLGGIRLRYNNRIAPEIDDKQRTEKLLTDIVGKRITYSKLVATLSCHN
jgi:hypothetical protein